MKNTTKIISLSAVLAVILFTGSDALAQCPMCRSAVESAMQNEGNTIGVGLNSGILYLLGAPYALVMGLLGYWLYNKRKAK
jgi:hypothetical protein